MRKPTEEEIKKFGNPIYRILMMEKSGADTIKYDSGKDSGFADTGATAEMGFLYSYEDAVDALHVNALDIREYVYDYAFIIMQFQGLYQCPGYADESRDYFAWNEEKQGFFEKEEPFPLHMLSF